jgi:nitrite reductase/ring-hydroxylating ferredoxin subunit
MIVATALGGCTKPYESSIPSVSFVFTCSLVQADYALITTPGQFKKVTKNQNGLPVGYAGLIIGQSVFSDGQTYVAYDAACPVEALPNISVDLKNDGIGTAVCSHCGATYNLSSSGFRSDGKGQEVLRSYPVIVTGATLQVRN